MLHFLPPTYPDELLYSLLARTHRCLDLGGPKRTLDILFGSRSVRAGVALQAHLGALSDRLPADRHLSAERLARDFTLFPYLTAFQPEAVRTSVLSALIDGPANSINVRLGLAASTIRSPIALRYCPACRAEMLQIHCELYWRRVHQLPGVLVCPNHGIALSDSLVVPGRTGQHEFVAADEDNCPPLQAVPDWTAEGTAIALLTRIARASSQILVDPPNGEAAEGRRDQIWDGLRALGFGKGRGRIRQYSLETEFRSVYSPIIPVLPAAEPANWLVTFLRGRQRAVHPLRHLLLELFIAIRLSGANCPLPMETAPSSSRELDWVASDRQAAAAVRECAEEIRAARPPKRVSAAEIQRRLGKPGWISRRQRKLHLTVQTLKTVCETVEQFQLRRVAWAVVELMELGLPVRAWRVRKLAGLGTSESRAVEVALAAIERGGTAC